MATGKKDDEENGEKEGGDGVSDYDDDGRPDIATASPTDRLADTKGNGDGINEKGCPQTERNGDGQFAKDEIDDSFIAIEALPKIKPQVVPNHRDESHMARLIETELARELVKKGKQTKLKVQVAIQGQQLRVSGKKRDVLQEVIALLKETKVDLPLQFNNFRD